MFSFNFCFPVFREPEIYYEYAWNVPMLAYNDGAPGNVHFLCWFFSLPLLYEPRSYYQLYALDHVHLGSNFIQRFCRIIYSKVSASIFKTSVIYGHKICFSAS